jgi:hypothetical protein
LAYRVWGEQFSTSDFSGSPVFFQPVKFPRDLVLHGVRTTIIVYDDPALTSLEVRLYSYKSNAIKQLITTSAVQTKASIISLDAGIRDIPFTFSTRPSLSAGDWYAFVLWANGYTGSDSSHISWMKDFPDPTNPTGLTNIYEERVSILPYRMSFIGADL